MRMMTLAGIRRHRPRDVMRSLRRTSRGISSVDITSITAARTQKAEATRKFAAGELFGLAP